MPYMDYYELRDMAWELNESAGEHPCQRGNAACCLDGAQVTLYDAINITEAFKDGTYGLMSGQLSQNM